MQVVSAVRRNVANSLLSNIMMICIMVYHINNECITGVFCEIASVGSRRDGTGTGAAAGAAFCAWKQLTYMQELCASNLGSKEQALRAAAMQM